MKKKIFIVLFILLFAVLSVFPVSAASGTLTAKSTNYSNNEITIDLYATHASPMVAAQVMVKYDPAVLKLKSTADGPVFDGKHLQTSPGIDTVPYMIIYMDIDKETAPNGMLTSYTFEVLNSTVDQTQLVFYMEKAVDPSNSEIKFSSCTFDVILSDAADTETPVVTLGGDNITVPRPTPDSDEEVDVQVEVKTDSSDSEVKTDGEESKPDSVVTILIIVGIVIAALGVATVLIVLFKNKSPKDK